MSYLNLFLTQIAEIKTFTFPDLFCRDQIIVEWAIPENNANVLFGWVSLVTFKWDKMP